METSRLILDSHNVHFRLGSYQLVRFSDDCIIDIQVTKKDLNYRLKIKLDNGHLVVAYNKNNRSEWINFSEINSVYGQEISDKIENWIVSNDFKNLIKKEEYDY